MISFVKNCTLKDLITIDTQKVDHEGSLTTKIIQLDPLLMEGELNMSDPSSNSVKDSLLWWVIIHN